ncbi:hypothetical protein HYH03_007979 [Edaphochlamys debaryana]|uniref:Pherophorin domain-containing protein n=1 Tax=Edaphochlamys debaryana TaxID=47281 RepID=A0A835XZ93_9CHLO|nr:hypothetical protein HYH03_007979 [Edaphochlamys debaryana]|eukprot:KAG2493757.1 hypothetical protein HYH03_007979 [Edaphochlamys debaryana]
MRAILACVLSSLALLCLQSSGATAWDEAEADVSAVGQSGRYGDFPFYNCQPRTPFSLEPVAALVGSSTYCFTLRVAKPANCSSYCCQRSNLYKIDFNVNPTCAVGATLEATVNGVPTVTGPTFLRAPEGPVGSTVLRITQLNMNQSDDGAVICLRLRRNHRGQGCTSLAALCVPPEGGQLGECETALWDSTRDCCRISDVGTAPAPTAIPPPPGLPVASPAPPPTAPATSPPPSPEVPVGASPPPPSDPVPDSPPPAGTPSSPDAPPSPVGTPDAPPSPSYPGHPVSPAPPAPATPPAQPPVYTIPPPPVYTPSPPAYPPAPATPAYPPAPATPAYPPAPATPAYPPAPAAPGSPPPAYPGIPLPSPPSPAYPGVPLSSPPSPPTSAPPQPAYPLQPGTPSPSSYPPPPSSYPPTPTTPEAPDVPGSPAVPSSPSFPPSPSSPGIPGSPSFPQSPSSPGLPGVPLAPGDPSAPPSPLPHGVPSAPPPPLAPAVPSRPGRPDRPSLASPPPPTDGPCDLCIHFQITPPAPDPFPYRFDDLACTDLPQIVSDDISAAAAGVVPPVEITTPFELSECSDTLIKVCGTFASGAAAEALQPFIDQQLAVWGEALGGQNQCPAYLSGYLVTVTAAGQELEDPSCLEGQSQNQCSDEEPTNFPTSDTCESTKFASPFAASPFLEAVPGGSGATALYCFALRVLEPVDDQGPCANSSSLASVEVWANDSLRDSLAALGVLPAGSSAIRQVAPVWGSPGQNTLRVFPISWTRQQADGARICLELEAGTALSDFCMGDAVDTCWLSLYDDSRSCCPTYAATVPS